MTQEAVVTKVFSNKMAEVAVTRTTACGGNCGNCESCIFQSELKALAKNRIGAMPGQKVMIESQTSKVFKAAFTVYVMPLVLFLLGFILGSLAGFSEGVCVILSFLGLVLGAVFIVLSQRSKRSEKDKITFEIIELI